jgi:hypothetical protein
MINAPYSNSPFFPDTDQHSIQRRWHPDPVENLTSPDNICNRWFSLQGSANTPTLHAPVAAGGSISVYYNGWECPENDTRKMGRDNLTCDDYQKTWVHGLGPVYTYMADCGGPCEHFDGKGKVWFLIYEDGMHPDAPYQPTFAQWNRTHGNWTVQIPQNLKRGQYLIRHEVLMIELDPVQAYMECAQLNVTGEGTASPGQEWLNEIPGVYKKDGEFQPLSRLRRCV